MDRKQFTAECLSFLNIQKKVRVYVYRKSMPSKIAARCAGFYQEKTEYHLIQVAIPAANKRGGLFNILAHEFVHAWQMENYPLSEDHGEIFQKKCAKLELYFLAIHGLNIGSLYVEGLDK